MGYNLNSNVITRRRPDDVQEDGLYFIKPENPNHDSDIFLLPVVFKNGDLYSMKLDKFLPKEGFQNNAFLEGPFK